jgi:glycolate oxidase FAD binding subunit
MTAAATVHRPATAADCARALGEADRARQAVRVRGAGTKDYLGELAPADVILETAGLTGVVAHVPADLTITVAAGTPLALIQRTLDAAGQLLALDPPHADAATIGGVLAANSTGFWRARYGGIRDQLIGIAVALADGSVARAGGRVVKNVAGYDLNKLFIGSLGTLGVVTECTFKVLPRPAATSGVRARFRHASDAFAAADAIARTPARPTALVVDGIARDEWHLLVQADGEPAAVARTADIAAQASATGTVERDDGVATALGPLRDLPARADALLVRASLPPAAQAPYGESAMRLDGAQQVVADAASGIVRVRLRGGDDDLVAAADTLLAAARVCGGSARVERRPEGLRIATWGDGDLPGLFLMRRIKAAFDPNGILEPGRGPIA